MVEIHHFASNWTKNCCGWGSLTNEMCGRKNLERDKINDSNLD
jgi:hypothetical protein